jgi:O-acetyl-ADP-ribose deacetylase (regulator of RNase III)
MPIQYISGDLFANRFNALALAHGCNCKGSMGAGIAVSFKERYPAMYEEYRRRCKATPREFNPGDVFLWKEEGKPWVFNLATQDDYWRSRATYENVEKCLSRMKHIADQEGVSTIAIPRIGAGYGGLSWNKVKPIIDRILQDWSGTLYVYDEYMAETP